VKLVYLIFLLVLSLGCEFQKKVCADFFGKASDKFALVKFNDHSWLVPFKRDSIEINLKTKIVNGEPLIVHCLVPLCDNNFQGIVPTTTSLGDGFSTRTNLYWATRNGMKRYYQLNENWQELTLNFNESDTILERVAFERDFENSAKVILICDAYRGDKMEKCLNDYFGFLSGKRSDSLNLSGKFLKIGEAADMIVFNGHNGIMDVVPKTVFASKGRMKDAVVIACSSHWNYTEPITYSNAYPLVTTMSSLYPGASILDAIISEWANLKDPEEIRFSAAKAYHKLKDCGMESANNLFYTGW